MKRTSRLRAPTSENDPGCVKTQKIERRREYFSEINCNRTSPRSFDDQKRHLAECSFYAIAAPLRFYTAKTQRGLSAVSALGRLVKVKRTDGSSLQLELRALQGMTESEGFFDLTSFLPKPIASAHILEAIVGLQRRQIASSINEARRLESRND